MNHLSYRNLHGGDLMLTVLKISILMALSLNGNSAYASRFGFDSAHSVALVGVLPDGVLKTTTSVQSAIKLQVKEQLKYSIGQLNGLDGGSPDMSKLEIKIGEVSEKDESGLRTVQYSAKLFIAWPKERKIPNKYTLKLPLITNWSGLRDFYKTYGSDEKSGKKCLDWSGHDISESIFWYYYRPNKSSCPLKDFEKLNPTDSVELEIFLKKSKKNTENKAPEYDEIWRDDKLVVTAIFGTAKKEKITESDQGVRAYVDTINALIKELGRPKSSNLKKKEGWFSNGLKNKKTLLKFDTPQGELDVALYLIEGIRSTSKEFKKEYNERTRTSDFISYSGHSGLGANIRALAQMGKFDQGQYQIFLVNGCDTFAYVDDALAKSHQKVNPDYKEDKFLDIITNAMPSYFNMNKRSNMAVINALIERKKTYREILSNFDKTQRAVVTGEQDNKWPESFY